SASWCAAISATAAPRKTMSSIAHRTGSDTFTFAFGATNRPQTTIAAAGVTIASTADHHPEDVACDPQYPSAANAHSSRTNRSARLAFFTADDRLSSVRSG